MRFNIREIAQKAGVSVATISRAMNPETRDKVAKKTLQKVDKLVDKYAYTPNLAARTLRQTATKTIGVIMPYFPGIFYNSYYSHVLSGVSDYIFQTDYQFKMLLLKEESRKWDHYDFKSGERVDGLIITHWPKFFSNKSILNKMNVPCVVINDLDKNIDTRFVCGDHEGGGAKAAEYLYSKGHRTIAVLAGPGWSKDSLQRVNGFKMYLNKVGFPISSDLIIRAGYREDLAYDGVESLLRKNSNITAIFCCNDEMAYGVIRKLRDMNISCPGDISVIGYDDNVRSASFDPPLTTVRVPVYDLAREGTKMLIDHLKDKDSNKPFMGQALLPVALVERQSVQSLNELSS